MSETVILTAFDGNDYEWPIGIFKEVVFLPDRVIGDTEQVAERDGRNWKLTHPHAPACMLERRWTLIRITQGGMEEAGQPAPDSSCAKRMLAAIKVSKWTKDLLATVKLDRLPFRAQSKSD